MTLLFVGIKFISLALQQEVEVTNIHDDDDDRHHMIGNHWERNPDSNQEQIYLFSAKVKCP